MDEWSEWSEWEECWEARVRAKHRFKPSAYFLSVVFRFPPVAQAWQIPTAWSQQAKWHVAHTIRAQVVVYFSVSSVGGRVPSMQVFFIFPFLCLSLYAFTFFVGFHSFCLATLRSYLHPM